MVVVFVFLASARESLATGAHDVCCFRLERFRAQNVDEWVDGRTEERQEDGERHQSLHAAARDDVRTRERSADATELHEDHEGQPRDDVESAEERGGLGCARVSCNRAASVEESEARLERTKCWRARDERV